MIAVITITIKVVDVDATTITIIIKVVDVDVTTITQDHATAVDAIAVTATGVDNHLNLNKERTPGVLSLLFSKLILNFFLFYSF